MSGDGAWGWQGGHKTLLELPAKADDAVAPSRRARVRYDHDAGQLEQSLAGGGWQALGAASAAVDDIAALQQLADETLPDGYLVGMANLRDTWQLDKTDTTTPDGITVVAATTGNWQRLGVPSDYWRRQTAWHIDPVAGDDENDGGSASAALKTWSEFRRRHGGDLGTDAVTVDIAA